MKVHLIAIGGSIMHNLAIALQSKGYIVTGSDDEIYNPARERLAKHQLLPSKMGWHSDNITPDIDVVILGMHAKADNPELLEAQALGLKIRSFPAFVYENIKDKHRIIVGGSHGKTSTTAMIMHVLRHHKLDFDYLVGAQLEGFDTMVRLTKNAKIAVIEGDEYLSSPLDARPKFLHYRPNTAIITGIAWDHINVFPSFEGYVQEFQNYVDSIEENGTLIMYEEVKEISSKDKKVITYGTPPHKIQRNKFFLTIENKDLPLQIFGEHNLQNLEAARLACEQVGIQATQFYEAIKTFQGAAKRLQHLGGTTTMDIYQDFAHAPSKVKATTQALKSLHKKRRLIAVLELHTYSSLNKDFHTHYKDTLAAADEAAVYYSEHTLQMKRLPAFSKEDLVAHFNHENLNIFTQKEELEAFILSKNYHDTNLLLMSSGNYGGLDLLSLANGLVQENLPKVAFVDWGRISYQAAWDRQTEIAKSIINLKRENKKRNKDEQEVPEHQIIFCEHNPVYTLGKSGSIKHLLLTEEELKEEGIEFYKINRGGDITFHGLGQIVGYPILDLDYFYSDVHRYVRDIEEVIIRTLADYGLEGKRISGYTGVWLQGKPHRKICAIGVHLSRWVTMHGFAFNINTDLAYFDKIIPCGIQEEDKTVTSLSAELNRKIELEEVKVLLKKHFKDVFNFRPRLSLHD